MKTILIIFGTRPEVVKLAPVILLAKNDPRFRVLVGSTGQHREMLRPLLKFFDIEPDFDLDLMKPGQSLTDISVAVMKGLEEFLKEHPVDGMIVQGDTTTSFAAGLVSFYHRIPLIHVEAGLRSGDMHSPYPEEFNRRATSLLAKFHFAPTETSRSNLLQEQVAEKDIYVTGNTGIDSLFEVRRRLQTSVTGTELSQRYSFLDSKKKLVLVTVHRRESFGEPMEEVMKGLVALSKREDVEILIPLHMNPQVRQSAKKIFGTEAKWIDKGEVYNPGQSKIWMCEPIDYVSFIYLLERAYKVITDSGGVQEEAPSLGKPTLIAREKTERPEAIAAGTSMLIPLRAEAFLETATEVLDTPAMYNRMAQARNPFGDGHASERILNVLAEKL